MAERKGLLGMLLQLGMEIQRWMETNPEASAKIMLWLEESNARGLASENEQPVRSFFDLILPANWRSLRIGVLNRAQQLMIDDGICLAWVPGPDVLEAIVAAPTREERDQVLVEKADAILRDIDQVVEEVRQPQLDETKAVLIEAVGAFRAGYQVPAQSTAATVITDLLENHYGFRRFAEARDFFDNEHPERAGFWSSRRAAVQWVLRAAILGPHQRTGNGGFSRHLTAHSASRTQYTEAHALEALLLAAGSLREMQEIYRVSEYGFAATPHLSQLTAPSI